MSHLQGVRFPDGNTFGSKRSPNQKPEQVPSVDNLSKCEMTTKRADVTEGQTGDIADQVNIVNDSFQTVGGENSVILDTEVSKIERSNIGTRRKHTKTAILLWVLMIATICIAIWKLFLQQTEHIDYLDHEKPPIPHGGTVASEEEWEPRLGSSKYPNWTRPESPKEVRRNSTAIEENSPTAAHVIHIVAHTHLDPGWIVSELSYYYGTGVGGVQAILNTMAANMPKMPHIKFIYSDISYLYIHLKKHPEHIPIFRGLIEEGRLEIAGAAFVLADQACPSLDDMLSHHQYGRHYLMKTLGVKQFSKTLWTIDQFGQSLTAASLAKQLGFEQHVINRVSSTLKKDLIKGNNTIFLQQFSDDPKDSLTTYLLKDHYETFMPSIGGRKSEISPYTTVRRLAEDTSRRKPQHNFLSKEFDLPARFDQFLRYAYDLLKYDRSKHHMFVYGGDFYFADFGTTISALYEYIIFAQSNNQTGRFVGLPQLMMSTLDEYFSSVRHDTAHFSSWDMLRRKEDSFPLITDQKNGAQLISWSGYFVTNPHLKRMIRLMGEIYRNMRSNLAAHLLRHPNMDNSAISQIIPDTLETEWALSVNLHHDTITGTSRQKVNEHYFARNEAVLRKSRLHWMKFIEAKVNFEKPQTTSAANELPLEKFEEYSFLYYKEEITPEFVANETAEIRRRGWDFRYTSYNETPYLDMSTGSATLLVLNSQLAGSRLITFVSEASHLRLEHCQREMSASPCNASSFELLRIVPDLGDKLYEYTLIIDSAPYQTLLLQFLTVQESETNHPEHVWVDFNSGQSIGAEKNSQEMFSVSRGTETVQIRLSQKHSLGISLHEYVFDQQSTADSKTGFPDKYVFATEKKLNETYAIKRARVWKSVGSLNHSQLVVVRLSFQQSNTCNLEIRYHTTGDSLSSRFICPELQTDGTMARDMVVRYHTVLEDPGVFQTDSNSFYSVERKRNRSSDLPEHNYYPVTAFGLLEDKASRFTVLTDRASGATSDSRGVLEIMYNRIGLEEDTDLGTEEGNILSPASTITHRLVFEATTSLNPDEGPVFRAAQIVAESQPTFLQLISKTVGLKMSLRTQTSDLVAPAKPQTLTKHCKIGLETSDGVKVFMRVTEYSAACSTATRPVTDFIEALGVSTTKACVEAASLDLLGKPMKEGAGITTQLLFPRLRAFHVLPCS